MVARLSAWILIGAALVGCHQTIDPCPRGYRASRDRDHCVVGDHLDASVTPVVDEPPEEGEDAEPSELEMLDATAPDSDEDTATPDDATEAMDGEVEASAFADTGGALMDAWVDAGSQELDAASEADSAASDAAPQPDAITPVIDAATVCAPTGVEAWRAAHLKSDIRDRITECRIDCDNDITCMDLCLRRATGIEDCNACSRAETACSGDWCAYACLPSRTDRACLSCFCQADCVRAFESCAQQDLGLCGADVFTFGPAPTGLALDSAALLIGKSATGALSMAKYDVTTELLSDQLTSINHFPTGPTKLVSLSLPSLELVFRYGSSCAQAPCSVRAFPMLRDGSFGGPVFDERWEAGYLDVKAFSFAGESYLVRLSGPNSSLPPTDNVLIDRITWNGERNLAVSTPAVRATALSPTSRRYSNVEPFALGNELFLFLLAAESGEAVVMRLQTTSAGLELSAASELIGWSLGWDQLEAFKSFGRWYLLAYKSGRVAADQEPAGQTRIWQPRLNAQGRVVLDPPVFDELRGLGISQIASFTDATGRARILLQEELLGRLSTHALDADPAQWHDNFSVARQVQQHGRTPPWDVLGLVKEGKW